jgi:DNA-binding transcriptional LysR family regulator
MNGINLNHLEAFCILAETLSFSKTASLLFTSQPAISRKIKILEEGLGYELFMRHNQEVKLTKKGMILKDKILPNYKELLHGLELGQKTTHTYKIGSIYEAGSRILVPALGKVLKKKSDFRFDLILRSANELLVRLQEGELDFILLHFEPTQKSLKTIKIHDYHTVMIGPKSFDKKKLEKMDSIPFVTYQNEDAFTEDFLKANLERKMVKKAETIASVNSHLAMIELVKAAQCFAVIPLSSLSQLEKNNVSIIIEDEHEQYLYLCMRDNYLGRGSNENNLQEIIESLKSGN